MLRAVNPPSVPAPPFLSQGMEATGTRTLYVSGQVGVGAQGPGKDIAEQALLAIANLNAVLAEGGMTAGNIAKVTIYLTDPASMQGFMEAAGGALPAPPPATTLLIVAGLASPELLIEIEAVAVA
jgi:enamine deaminase RidA (YjgF/YER057c/UK114 family)